MSNSLANSIEQERGNHNKPKAFFDYLKAQSLAICNEIEADITSHKSPRIFHPLSKSYPIEDDNRQGRYNKSPSQRQDCGISQPFDSIVKEISKSKAFISEYQHKIEAIDERENVSSMESTLKSKTEQVKSLSLENSTLSSIKRKQIDDDKKNSLQRIKREEVIVINERNKRMKEEMKVNKDFNQTLMLKVKSQEAQISVIEKKCQIIRENIEYRQRQQMQLLAAQERGEDEHYGQSYTPEFFLEKALINEKLFISEEAEYKHGIRKQKERIDQIEKEIKVLTAQISQIDKRAYIYEWEIRKEQSINEIRCKLKRDFNRKQSRGNGLIQSTKCNSNGNILKDHKPFNIKEMNHKPFEINKVLNTNHNISKVKPPNLIGEIDALKKDITSTIEVIDKLNPPIKSQNSIQFKSDKVRRWKVFEQVSQEIAFFPSKGHDDS